MSNFNEYRKVLEEKILKLRSLTERLHARDENYHYLMGAIDQGIWELDRLDEFKSEYTKIDDLIVSLKDELGFTYEDFYNLTDFGEKHAYYRGRISKLRKVIKQLEGILVENENN